MKAAHFFLVCLATFQISACGSDSAQRVAQPSVDPLAALPSVPAAEISLTGETVVRIADGDFVHPTFSPDGSKLAYSGVVVVDGKELTEVLVHDLTTKKRTNLLDSEASRKYAVYKSFVMGMEWKDNTTLQAEISDGDVDWTIVRFDVRSGKILSEKYGEPDFEFPRNTPLFQEALAAFPSWREDVLARALRNARVVGAKRYVVQKNYAGEDHHIWCLDVERKQMKKLLELPDDWSDALRGAFGLGKAVVFLVRNPRAKRGYLLLSQAGDLTKLAEFDGIASLRVAHASSERVLFRVHVGRPGGKSENLLFLFDRNGLKRVTGVANLYDVVVDQGGRMICYTVRSNGQRHLLVKELSQ